jgi:OOP family OmpA-OmpF porin
MLIKSICISFICFFVYIMSIFSQELVPNEKEVLVDIYVGEESGKALENETVIFFGRRNQSTFEVTTDANGKASILLPKRNVYDVKYKDLFENKDYTILEVPESQGLYYFEIEIIIEPSRTFTLENVYFEFGKSTLKAESFPALDELVELLKAKPDMIVEIGGHTDNVGSDEANVVLSKNRAESVKQYAVSKGINSNRLEAVGYGATKPIATNETEQGRQTNRRTEVRILN